MDLDEEELKATRKLHGLDKENGSDINVGSIEKDIKRCEQLIKPEHANWIGISNQLAIAHLIDRIKELEAKLEFKQWGDLDNTQFEEYMSQFVPKQKVKDLLIEIQKEYEKLDKASDEFLRNKEKTVEDYVLEKERLTTMQTLAYCRDNLEELSEDK